MMDPPLLLRIEFTLAECDPWLWLHHPKVARQPFLAWQDSQRGTVFAAWGVAHELSTDGPKRIVHADRLAAELAHQTLVVDDRGEVRGAIAEEDEPVPFLCGGFAFAAQRSLTGPWAEWPGGWLFVPRVVVQRSASGVTRALITERIRRGTSRGAVLRRLQSQRHELEQGLIAEPAPSSRSSVKQHLHESDAEQTRWLDIAARAQQHMASGMLRKVVIARSVALQARGTSFDPLGTLFTLRQQHEATGAGCTLFAIGRGGDDMFLGATPETLIRLEGNTVETSALAGTIEREGDPARDAALACALTSSPKAREEHRFVLEAIVQVLQQAGCELTVGQATQVKRLRAVQHLETAISGRLCQPTSLLTLVQALHPTPAVGGWPTADALHWIAHNEQLDRGWYAGPVGWIAHNGSGQFAVALRCALIGPRGGWAFAGAGLTERSQPQAEWTETALKLQTIAEALCVRPRARREAALEAPL